MHLIVTANSAWNIINFRKPIIESFLQQGYKVSVIAPSDHAVKKITDMGCDYYPIQMNRSGMNPINELFFFLALKKFFKEIKPDCILSFTIKNNIFGAFAARSLDIPFIPNISGLGTAFMSNNLIKILVKLLYKFAFKSMNTVFFQNPDDADLFISNKLIKSSQVALVPGSGVDLEYFSYNKLLHDDKTTFLFIGRLLVDKGINEFINAAKKVKDIYPTAHFQVLGGIDLNNRSSISNEKVESWVSEGAVEYLGLKDDVRPFIMEATCVVLPSYREGAPRALIEAAAMGRPLIASDVPGCRSVVEHGKNGFLCDVKDEDSLASAFIRFINLSKHSKSNFSFASRRKMSDEFAKEIVVKGYNAALGNINS